MSQHAILVHGMGRFATSMLPLAQKLQHLGIQPHRFQYFAAVESMQKCTDRLSTYIEKHCGSDRYVVIGHSLGTVLLRRAVTELAYPPAACFFLAPPTVACRAAKFFQPLWPYKVWSGEMGQLLASDEFMSDVPCPTVSTFVYVGTKGRRGFLAPHGNELNDGILRVSETVYPAGTMQQVPARRSFIMHSRRVMEDVAQRTQQCLL